MATWIKAAVVALTILSFSGMGFAQGKAPAAPAGEKKAEEQMQAEEKADAKGTKAAKTKDKAAKTKTQKNVKGESK